MDAQGEHSDRCASFISCLFWNSSFFSFCFSYTRGKHFFFSHFHQIPSIVVVDFVLRFFYKPPDNLVVLAQISNCCHNKVQQQQGKESTDSKLNAAHKRTSIIETKAHNGKVIKRGWFILPNAPLRFRENRMHITECNKKAQTHRENCLTGPRAKHHKERPVVCRSKENYAYCGQNTITHIMFSVTYKKCRNYSHSHSIFFLVYISLRIRLVYPFCFSCSCLFFARFSYLLKGCFVFCFYFFYRGIISTPLGVSFPQ